VDGVQEPHLIRMRRGEETLELAVESAAHNGSLTPASSTFPATRVPSSRTWTPSSKNCWTTTSRICEACTGIPN
jgi:hypothetical protein